MRNDTGDLGIRLSPPTLGEWASAGPEKDVAVLMSGGVDSSVAAMLLKRKGWNVLGLTMSLPMAGESARKRPCCGLEAGYVCRELGIPHYFIDVREAFERLVIEPFRRAYAEGRTPSPCADCNSIMKFTLVWDFMEQSFGIKHLATGHYARVLRREGRSYLARAVDPSRDQSYFLYGTPRHRLHCLLLPIGELEKPRVRELASEAKLPVARRPDSMELCFVSEGDYRSGLDPSMLRLGPIVDTEGNILGEHNGIAHFTIGQREGLGIAAGRRLYVTSIDAHTNTITVGSYAQACSAKITADEINALIPEELHERAHLLGKVRSQGEPSPCTVAAVGDDLISVEFDSPQFAPAPGQRLALYNEEGHVVAGGVITCGQLPDRA